MTPKMWDGRFTKATDTTVNDFNSSIRFDCRMAMQDIRGSKAHAAMLCSIGILTTDELDQIETGLNGIAAEIANGTLPFDPQAEDIHMFIEAELTARIGEAGKKLHTGRSRNDQVATDLKLWLRDASSDFKADLIELLETIFELASVHVNTIMPGYTHLQRAQPITFGYHLMAYGQMFLRDLDRLEDAVIRMNISPLGNGALAGTTYPLDREQTAADLGFNGITLNALDGVSDRDHAMELAFVLALFMVHISRFSEEIILWSSQEFKFIELDDAFSTGSSIMPQKKNPDVAELARGKTGRVIGDLMTLLTMMKNLPLAYNKDMQEDKEAIFDAFDTVALCLPAFTGMLKTLRVRADRMREAAAGGFTNATDLADYLVIKGLPFREAHHVSGQLVHHCIENNTVLEKLDLDTLKSVCPLFDTDVYEAISLETCVNRRSLPGGPAPETVSSAITASKERLTKFK
ncbi:MAG: argininosuccinate lyase [Fastidiosipilaceae bacterium]|jgi:argininosuccinate lyase|nr:argininosuccinate lyase [Clostridiaceae bacterium]